MSLATKSQPGGLATTGGSGVCTIFPGDCVEIFGLTSEKGRQLNGQNGVATKRVDGGRFEVRIGVEERVTIKPENLRICHNKPTEKVGKLGFGEHDRQKAIEECASFRPDDIVEIGFLDSMQGQELNNRVGVVVFDEQTPPDRVKVRVELGGPGNRFRHATLKHTNLRKLQMANLTDAQRTQLGIKDSKSGNEPADDQFTRVDLAVDSPAPMVDGAPFEVGDVVEVSGLQSESGRKLNGDKGVVLECIMADGRADVRLPEGTKRLKFENLVKMDLVGGDRFMVEVFGLQSDSGKAMNGQRGFARAWKPETGRYEVKLSKDKIASLKPENLRLLNVPK